jgi:hypothetical protein
VAKVLKAAPNEQMLRLLRGDVSAASAAPAPSVSTSVATTQFGEQPVSVGDTDVTGVSIVMRDGPKVSGRVEFEVTPPKTAAQMSAGSGVTLTPLSGTPGALGSLIGADPAMPDADGRFRTLGHAPDRYVISFGRGGRGSSNIKSITANGRDMTNTPLELKDTDVMDVVIKISDRLGTISGVVRGTSGAAAPTATAFVFPADYRALVSSGLMSGRVQTVAASRAGAYSDSCPVTIWSSP